MRSHFRGVTSIAALSVAACVLGACTSSKPMTTAKAERSKEYFSEAEYGVKASPRVTNQKSNLPRGGGREQVGKPYTVKGKVYYPKEEKNYSKVGLASWYGDAFHGRLTANGEVYDMTHLTAAHPTMPLPSYARVTNLDNGSSVIVRINDRGPYSHGRLIDLSKRAAEMLDYTHAGTAKVKVDYVGRAPLHGQDDEYLMASYRPSNSSPSSDGLPTSVMIAMNGPTPTTNVGPAPFPGEMAGLSSSGAMGLSLPEVGPIAPERPVFDGGQGTQIAMASLSYAQEGSASAGGAFSRLGLDSDAVVQSWKRMNDNIVPEGQAYVAAGSFTNVAEAERLAEALRSYGKIVIEKAQVDGKVWFGVNLFAEGGRSLDDLLLVAWSHGAPNAIAIRD